MDDLQNKDLHDIAVNAEFHNFIHGDTSRYDLASRDIDFRDSGENFSIDLLYVDLDSQVFRVDDLVIDNSVIAELQEEFSGVAKSMEQRIENIEANKDLTWAGQYNLRGIGNITETYWVEEDVYMESAPTESECKKIDELSRNLLGYSIDEWHEYEWALGSQ